MQNNVTQSKLRKQELKKYMAYAVVLLLVVAFLAGAILLNAKSNPAKAYEGYSTVTPDTVLDYTVKAPTSSELGAEGSYGIMDNYRFDFESEEDMKDYKFAFVSNPGTVVICSIDGFGTGGLAAGDYMRRTVYLTPDNAADVTEDMSKLINCVPGTSLSFSAAEHRTNGSVFVTVQISQSIYNAHQGHLTFAIVKQPETVSLPETPDAPEGQHFVGWYYDEALTDAYEDGDVITEDTELFAKFAVNTYTITYMINGTEYSSSELEFGDAIQNVVPTGVTAGKEFSGWYNDAELTTAFDFTGTASADVTLYGTIDSIMLTVTFYVDNEVYTTLEVAYGSTLVKMAESDATAAAVLQVFNFAEDSDVLADTEITEDTEVTGTLDEKTVNWINAGVWLELNWPWLVAVAGVVIVIIAGSVILVKKRG